MKPKDLKFPYSWEERKPHMADGALFVPDYYDKHHEWEKRPLFEDNKPTFIEYCSGNGAWVIEKAANESSCNWIAVEWRFERARKIWSKAKNRGLTNLLVVCGEALTFTRHYVESGSISGVYVNFPDPWPKEKHAKNRLFQAPFVDELMRIAKLDASAIFATDDATYSEQICREMLALEKWSSVYPAPYFVTEWPGYGASYFDALWREKGRTIRYMQFRKYS